jgi:hypothetical protein
MAGMAMAANARLRAVFPGGFALDGDPHVTVADLGTAQRQLWSSAGGRA